MIEDRFDVRIARAAPDVLAPFNDAGVLVASDVHVARRLCALARETDGDVVLAVAMAARAPRVGHVYADLQRVRETAAVDAEEVVDVSALPWPDAEGWIARVGQSPLVGEDRPLRLEGSALYLDRYWGEEVQVAEDLQALATPAEVDRDVLADGVRRLFAGDDDDADQRRAAAAAVLRRFAVVAGGPGTGKTTTVARIMALLEEQALAAGSGPPLVALAAPTGKAAARLQQAVREEAAKLAVNAGIRGRLLEAEARTLHRLLGFNPGNHSRFRHNRANRLAHDVVIVDETSMVSLSMMARLAEAVRPSARLILVGDPGQLTSIEAGAVLGDIVGPAAVELRMTPSTREAVGAAAGAPVDANDPPAGSTIGDGVVVLRRIHRFKGAIQDLAEAIRKGDGDTAVDVLRSGADDVLWIEADVADPTTHHTLGTVRSRAIQNGRAIHESATAGDAKAALEHLSAFRILCAHRRGPYGVFTWAPRVEAWLSRAIDGFTPDGAWYVGRPLLVTRNDYATRLYNGDTGVVISSPDGSRLTAAFDRQGEIATFAPGRLESVETVYAMTIHKAQGSQFGTAAVILPEPTSPILTRELLYTGITRARKRLILVGPEAAVRAAVERPIERATGMGARLWAGGTPAPAA